MFLRILNGAEETGTAPAPTDQQQAELLSAWARWSSTAGLARQGSDPFLGHTTAHGAGFVVHVLSPYQADLSWENLTEPDEIDAVLTDLGRAAAKALLIGPGQRPESGPVPDGAGDQHPDRRP